jgi:hypothetical protein
LQETREEGFVPCRGGVFADNIVVFDVESARRPNIGPGTAPETFEFARNVWYFETDPARSEPVLPAREMDGVHGVDPLFADAAGGDFSVREERAGRAGAGAFRGP